MLPHRHRFKLPESTAWTNSISGYWEMSPWISHYNPLITFSLITIFPLCTFFDSYPMFLGVNSQLGRFRWCPQILKEFQVMNIWRNPPLPSMRISSGYPLQSHRCIANPGPLMLLSWIPEDWEVIWDLPFKILVSLWDHLIQFKTVHRAHLISYKLHKMGPAHFSACWRCDHPRGDFIHIFWSCPAINTYWTQVISEINSLTSTPIAPSPKCVPARPDKRNYSLSWWREQ